MTRLHDLRVIVRVEPGLALDPVRFVMAACAIRYEMDVRVVSASEPCDFEDTDVVLIYGSSPLKIEVPSVHVQTDREFWNNYGSRQTLPRSPCPRLDDLPILYPAGGVEKGAWIHHAAGERSVEIRFDLLAAVFVLLSRYEELFPDSLDEHGRYRPEESIACREGVLDRPLVDESMEVLARWLSVTAGRAIALRAVWRTSEFTVCLTHDIDRYSKFGLLPPIRDLAAHVLRGSLGESLRLARQYISSLAGHDPYDPLALLDLARRFGVPQTFFLMAAEPAGLDTAPLPSGRHGQRTLRQLRCELSEVGLHSGYLSPGDAAAVRREAESLVFAGGIPVDGVRQHYLRWDPWRSWRAFDKAGFSYDSSLGYAAMPGFRCGTCFPYRAFDHLSHSMLDLWEVPLLAMDTTLFSYRGLAGPGAVREIMRVADAVSRVHGVLTLLWHNTSLDEFARPEGREALTWTLTKLVERGARFTSLGSIVAKVSLQRSADMNCRREQE
jgi:peptidoglycan/xylan/chitin deacetylase (PgdA/CDA1 family)